MAMTTRRTTRYRVLNPSSDATSASANKSGIGGDVAPSATAVSFVLQPEQVLDDQTLLPQGSRSSQSQSSGTGTATDATAEEASAASAASRNVAIEEYCCVICGGLLQDPHCICVNEHAFCKACISRHVSTMKEADNPVKCPTCRESAQPMRPMRMWQRAMDSAIHVHCPYRPECTSFAGHSVTELCRHLERDCKMQPVTCQHCQESVARSLLQRHCMDTCQARPVVCPHCAALYKPNANGVSHSGHGDYCGYRAWQCSCGERIMMQDMPHHRDKCPELVISCEFCQETRGWRGILSAHYEACPKRPKPCARGCGSWIARYASAHAGCPNEPVRCPYQCHTPPLAPSPPATTTTSSGGGSTTTNTATHAAATHAAATHAVATVTPTIPVPAAGTDAPTPPAPTAHGSGPAGPIQMPTKALAHHLRHECDRALFLCPYAQRYGCRFPPAPRATMTTHLVEFDELHQRVKKQVNLTPIDGQLVPILYPVVPLATGDVILAKDGDSWRPATVCKPDGKDNQDSQDPRSWQAGRLVKIQFEREQNKHMVINPIHDFRIAHVHSGIYHQAAPNNRMRVGTTSASEGTSIDLFPRQVRILRRNVQTGGTNGSGSGSGGSSGGGPADDMSWFYAHLPQMQPRLLAPGSAVSATTSAASAADDPPLPLMTVSSDDEEDEDEEDGTSSTGSGSSGSSGSGEVDTLHSFLLNCIQGLHSARQGERLDLDLTWPGHPPPPPPTSGSSTPPASATAPTLAAHDARSSSSLSRASLSGFGSGFGFRS